MKQIKSKERVRDHGEVFTPEKTVNDMLDMMGDTIYNIKSRVLEPSCGDGAFLTEVLRRKLETVKKEHGGSLELYERNAMIAICSLYGIDIQLDNVHECRKYLLDIFLTEYTNTCADLNDEEYPDPAIEKSVKHVLMKNIVRGDSLNLDTAEGGKGIFFPEWKFKGDTDEVIRNNFSLSEMILAKAENRKPMSTDTKYPHLEYRRLYKQK